MCYIVFLIHVLLEYSISCFTISNITNRSFDKLTMMTLTVVMHNNGHLSRKQMYTHHYRDIFFYTILKFFLQCFVLFDYSEWYLMYSVGFFGIRSWLQLLNCYMNLLNGIHPKQNQKWCMRFFYNGGIITGLVLKL